MKRPEQRPRRDLSQEERDELATKAVYTGSSEHKGREWWGGIPEARQLGGGRIGRPHRPVTTECPLTTLRDQVRATHWVQNAIREGKYKYFEGYNQGFPQRIWYQADDSYWVGYCINRTIGNYKGWPVNENEINEIFGRVD